MGVAFSPAVTLILCASTILSCVPKKSEKAQTQSNGDGRLTIHASSDYNQLFNVMLDNRSTAMPGKDYMPDALLGAIRAEFFTALKQFNSFFVAHTSQNSAIELKKITLVRTGRGLEEYVFEAGGQLKKTEKPATAPVPAPTAVGTAAAAAPLPPPSNGACGDAQVRSTFGGLSNTVVGGQVQTLIQSSSSRFAMEFTFRNKNGVKVDSSNPNDGEEYNVTIPYAFTIADTLKVATKVAFNVDALRALPAWLGAFIARNIDEFTVHGSSEVCVVKYAALPSEIAPQRGYDLSYLSYTIAHVVLREVCKNATGKKAECDAVQLMKPPNPLDELQKSQTQDRFTPVRNCMDTGTTEGKVIPTKVYKIYFAAPQNSYGQNQPVYFYEHVKNDSWSQVGSGVVEGFISGDGESTNGQEGSEGTGPLTENQRLSFSRCQGRLKPSERCYFAKFVKRNFQQKCNELSFSKGWSVSDENKEVLLRP